VDSVKAIKVAAFVVCWALLSFGLAWLIFAGAVFVERFR
jgi:hypothetical protein